MLAAAAKQAQNLNGLHSKCLYFAHITTPKASLPALLQVMTQAFRLLCLLSLLHSMAHYGGFPGYASGKEPACQCRRRKRRGFDPWVGKMPWRRKWQPTPVLLPGESHGQRSLVGYSSWGCKELDTTERLSSLTGSVFKSPRACAFPLQPLSFPSLPLPFLLFSFSPI